MLFICAAVLHERGGMVVRLLTEPKNKVFSVCVTPVGMWYPAPKELTQWAINTTPDGETLDPPDNEEYIEIIRNA